MCLLGLFKQLIRHYLISSLNVFFIYLIIIFGYYVICIRSNFMHLNYSIFGQYNKYKYYEKTEKNITRGIPLTKGLRTLHCQGTIKCSTNIIRSN